MIKGYLNEVGRKQIPFLNFGVWVKGYLNEVGRKPMSDFDSYFVRDKKYLKRSR